MADPTYDRAAINANPIWKMAFVMSEVLNDVAPIGWGRYIYCAEQLSKESEPKFTHRHLKRGTKYKVIGLARAQCSLVPIKDGDMLTLYQGEDGVYSVRPTAEFFDGRFEPLDEKSMKDFNELE